MHRFAIGESKFARQTHTLAAYNARRDLWDQGGQSPEVRKERPNLIDVALEYRVAGTNAPGSALWSDAVFIVDSYSLHTHSRSSTPFIGMRRCVAAESQRLARKVKSMVEQKFNHSR